MLAPEDCTFSVNHSSGPHQTSTLGSAGTMAMFKDIHCNNWDGGKGTTGIYWVGATTIPQCTGQLPTRNYPAQNVDNVEAEKT